jgi:flagellar basal body-associated protein FliL
MRESKKLRGELDEILKSMARVFNSGAEEPKKLNANTISMAVLLVKLGQLADQTTRRLIRLTWALVILTAALLAYTIVLYKDAHEQTQRQNLQQYHAAQHP